MKNLRRQFAACVCAFSFLAASGCSYVRMSDGRAGFTSVTPAWPWQDSNRVLDRMNLSAKTNSFTASLRGLNDSETTSTNAAALVNGIVGAAVSAVVNAKP